MSFLPVMLGAILLAFIAQEYIPPLPWLHGARVFLMPVVFFYGALATPAWGMLILAFFTGFFWDALLVQATDSTVEIALGWSIILYAALGAIMNGFRPLYQRGHGWEIHCLISGPLVALFTLGEYLMITFRRGDFLFPPVIWWRIGGAGLVATLLAPVVFFILHSFARAFGWLPEPRKAASV